MLADVKQTPLVITLAWLRDRGAKADTARTFRAKFGNEIILTRTVVTRMGVNGIDLDWLARHILNADLLRRYNERMATVLADFRGVIGRALAVCDTATAEAEARGEPNLKRRVAEIHREYRRTLALALKSFVVEQAEAIADILDLT